MLTQNNEDDSMNFSVIDKNEDRVNQFEFSVQSLLEDGQQSLQLQMIQPPDQQNRYQVFKKIKQIQSTTNKSQIKPTIRPKQKYENNFLKDLSRMQKELSFQTQQYNIYDENQNSFIDFKQNSKSKTLSFLKVTKQYTNKSNSKVIDEEIHYQFNDYFGDLIIDFKKGKDKRHKVDSKNVSNTLSSVNSQSNLKRESKSRHQIKGFLRPKDKSITSKLLNQQKRSKSKSVDIKSLLSRQKNSSHLKANTDTQTFSSKAFSEYYGTEVPYNDKKVDLKKKQSLIAIKSRQKSSKSKQKLGLLSPKGKLSPNIIKK